VIIIGAGPAGLTAAHELAIRNVYPLVLEQSDKPGGLARTEVHWGYRFDIGGHRFFTKVDEVRRLWEEILGEEFVAVSRQSRIYYQGRFYSYPLQPLNALSNLGVIESCRVMLSYFKSKLRPHPDEDTFEQWVTNRFGGRLYETFFKTYTEKVWGIPCDRIQADWAAQRIRGLSLWSAVVNALFKTGKVKSLITEFQYPREGPGMMWEAFCRDATRRGGQVEFEAEVIEVQHRDNRVIGVLVHVDGRTAEYSTDQVISTMPLNLLVSRLNPPPPSEVLEAAGRLRYRDFILVGLVINRKEIFPDNWIYVHSPEVLVGRIQNFKNWSPDMVPDPSKTSLGMEYFCTQGDLIWARSDKELVELAMRELVTLGLADKAEVQDGVVIRQLKAYPVYTGEYRHDVDIIKKYLDTIENLQTIGRNGMHRYNNQDHSMLTAMLAVENMDGAQHDLWAVNTERSYHEESMKHDSA